MTELRRGLPPLPDPEDLAKQIEAWNDQHGIGSPVIVTLDDGAERNTKTRSDAWVLNDHTAVIMLEGITGCYRLDRVRPANG